MKGKLVHALVGLKSDFKIRPKLVSLIKMVILTWADTPTQCGLQSKFCLHVYMSNLGRQMKRSLNPVDLSYASIW